MYKQITIKNIKTFSKEQNLKIAPLTLLYGENSSGKTTLLKALLKESMGCECFIFLNLSDGFEPTISSGFFIFFKESYLSFINKLIGK